MLDNQPVTAFRLHNSGDTCDVNDSAHLFVLCSSSSVAAHMGRGLGVAHAIYHCQSAPLCIRNANVYACTVSAQEDKAIKLIIIIMYT